MKMSNFKALRNVDIALRERNVLIGPNKSGKSTILQVLNILTQVMNGGDVSRAFGGELGFQQWLWKVCSEGDIHIEIWGEDTHAILNRVKSSASSITPSRSGSTLSGA